MIFKTIEDDATKSGKAITFLGRKISDIKEDLNNKKEFFQSVFGFGTFGLSNEQLGILKEWNKAVKQGGLTQARQTEIIKDADEATQEYFQGLKGAPATLDGLAKATGNVSTGAKVAAKGMGLLKTTLNTLTSIGIMALVNLGMSLLQAGWDALQEALKSTDEKIKELTQDLNSSLQEIQSISKEFQNLKSSADEVIPKFAKLSEGVDKFGNNISLTDEEYKEFLDLNNKIADMFPELNVGLDSNGNAMLALSGNADTLTESLYALLEVQRQTANQKIADGFGDAFEAAKKTANAYSTKREEIESDINPFNNLKYIIDNPDTWSNEIIAESGQQMSYLDYAVEKLEYLFSTKNKKEQLNELKNKYTGENGGIWWEFLFKDQEVQNLIDNTIDGYERQLHDVDVKVQSIWNRLSSSISAVLEQNPLYQSLDDELRNMTKIISSGVDPSQFDDDSALIDYIETNIISPLANLPKEVQKSISQIPDLQEQLKDGLISKEVFADKIKNVFAEIQDQTSQEHFNAFINAFVSGYNQMGIEGDNFIDVLQNLILYYIDCAKAGKTAEGATKSFIEVLSNVQSLSNGLDKLASIYKDIQNQDDFNWSSILNNEDFAKQFENCGVVYTDFIKAISNSTTDIGSCQEAFNNLVTEYIYGSGVLDDLTEETKSATIAMLEQMGVVNASEVVEKNLYSQKEKNTKRFCGVLKQMAEAYPEIQSAADDYLSGLTDEKQLIAQLSDEYDTDEDNHYQYLLTKLNHEEDFIRASTEGSGAIVDYFAENYGVDLTNYKSYIGRKKALQADFDSSVAGGLTKYFNADGSVTAEFLALTDQAKSGIQSIYEQYQNAIEDLDNLYEPVDFQFHVDFDDDSRSGLSKSAADTSKTFNWIEIAIEKISKAASKLGNIVSNTFKSWTDRNNTLKKQIKEVNKEIELQQQAYDVYIQKANSVGLPEYWANKVRNGSIDISVVTDENLADKIDEFKEWYDKAQDCKDAIDELKDSLNNLYMTSFDNVVSKFDDILSEIDFSKSMIDEKISQSSQSSYSSFDNNQINLRKNIGYYEQLIAQEKKSIAQLEKEKAELTAILRLGIQNGTIVEGTEAWAKMRDQINDVTLSIEKANTSLLDYGESINKVYEELFNNISNDFDNKLNEIQHLSNSYDTGISMLEAKGYLGSINFYTALQNSQRESLDLLKQELASLEQAFAESGVEEFSDEWFEMRGKILDVNQAIREGELSLLEYAKAMREIEWEHFDYLQERISDLTTEADFLIDLLDSADLYDDKGNFTDKGLATLGLHAQNYNVYMAQADKYYQEMLSIEKELASDPYNTDLVKRREELLELQQKSILAAEDEKQAMIDLAKSGIEAELNALKELIQAYTDALDSAKSLHDYQRKIADQTSEIASLEKQLLAYENDNS